MKPYVVTATLLVAWLGGTALAQDPQPDEQAIDAHLPLISQEDSPIQFDVKFWPTHILAGERVNMALTLRNAGSEPFRIPTSVPEVYELRVNLYLDHPQFGPRQPELNVFYSSHLVPPEATEGAWARIRQSDTVMPGETYVIKSNNVFGEASRRGRGPSAEGVIRELETARVRTVIRLDDRTVVPTNWVEFTIEQPDPREEDWRGDIVYTGAGDVPTRYGLLKQRVGDRNFWFIASERDRRHTHLRRLPIEEIRQVIPPQRVGERLRKVAVLGTDAAGAWHYYGPHLCEESPRGRTVGFLELGKGKTWRLQLTNETDVEIIEVTK